MEVDYRFELDLVVVLELVVEQLAQVFEQLELVVGLLDLVFAEIIKNKALLF